MDAALLVPVKSFTVAKQRLAGALDNASRASLAKWMAERVLAAAEGVARPVVVCDSEDVAHWAAARDVLVIESRDTGLNGAVAFAIGELAAMGFIHVIVAHSDLPAAESFAAVIDLDRPVLVPDRHRDGTNVMSLPIHTALRVRPQYGAGSFDRHLEQLTALGSAPYVLTHPQLSVDVDTPDDLSHPTIQEVLPEWLRMNPANLR